MTSGETEPSAGRRWDRFVDFVSRGNGHPGGVHVPLSRLGLPGRAWRLLTWALAVADLVALTRTMWACFGFFFVFLLLWLVHTRYWAAAAAVVVFGVGIAAALFVQGEEDWWQAALVTVLVCLVTGTWVTRVQMARADLMTALADKERAMEALARTQGELAAAEHAAGAAAERERWAREVHDTLWSPCPRPRAPSWRSPSRRAARRCTSGWPRSRRSRATTSSRPGRSWRGGGPAP